MLSLWFGCILYCDFSSMKLLIINIFIFCNSGFLNASEWAWNVVSIQSLNISTATGKSIISECFLCIKGFLHVTDAHHIVKKIPL